jgi:hypothetical protein
VPASGREDPIADLVTMHQRGANTGVGLACATFLAAAIEAIIGAISLGLG